MAGLDDAINVFGEDLMGRSSQIGRVGRVLFHLSNF